jgi:hypothetical protein
MKPELPAHPFGHGTPLTDSEGRRWTALATELGWQRSGARTVRTPRRLRSVSGWPAWVVAAFGLVLVWWGGTTDNGSPLLVGALLTFTFHFWVQLPRLRPRQFRSQRLRRR